jgi:hypothetical protein
MLNTPSGPSVDINEHNPEVNNQSFGKVRRTKEPIKKTASKQALF